MRRLTLALGALIILAVLPAHAAIVTYQLGDHLNAAGYISDPTSPYGLRVDSATGSPTFSVDTNLGGAGGLTTISWDPANLAAGATITGTMERNGDGTFWTVAYSLTGLSVAENGGFKATGGSGSADEIGGALRSITLAGETNGSGIAFEFDNDGHRLANPGDLPDGWVGRGWLLPPDSTDDWLVTGVLIPVPAAAWMFGSALGLLGWMRRRVS